MYALSPKSKGQGGLIVPFSQMIVALFTVRQVHPLLAESRCKGKPRSVDGFSLLALDGLYTIY